MTITKASELFAHDDRFFLHERSEEERNEAVFAPLPEGPPEAWDAGGADRATLVETGGPLDDWWLAVDHRNAPESTP